MSEPLPTQQRLRHRSTASVSQGASSGPPINTVPLLIVGLIALVVPLIPSSIDSLKWHGLRTVAFEVGCVLLFVSLFTVPPTLAERRLFTQPFRTKPIICLVVLLGWGALSAVIAPNKAFAFQGLLLLAGGTLIVAAISVFGRERPQYQIVLDALIAAALLVSMSGFALYGKDHMPIAVGFYHVHTLYGATLSVLVPIMLALSISPASLARRLLAQGAFLCTVFALLLATTRSSWLGDIAGLVVFGALLLWVRRSTSASPATQPTVPQNKLLSALLPGIVILGVVIYFLVAAPDVSKIGHRFGTLTTTVAQGREGSVEWRFDTWQGVEQMIRHKPLLGWGIGCYPLYQNDFTGTGQGTRHVVKFGPTINDEAHNSYLQAAAEMGIPAALLWLAVLITTLTLGIASVNKFSTGGLRQRALIGCLAALVAQAVDACANPGWMFGEVSLFLWIVLGLTITLSLGVPDAEATLASEPPTMFPLALRLAGGLVLGVALLWLIVRTAGVLPTPTL